VFDGVSHKRTATDPAVREIAKIELRQKKRPRRRWMSFRRGLGS
jgi:hypothetical protein